MQSENPSEIFNKEHAVSYDKQRAKLAPMREALHLLIRMVLSKLPANARILCIGVGTGAELIYLAKAFPQWQFTAVDPAAAMLNICRQQAEEGGFASRCTFHEGYLDSLPDTSPFDAATSLLVSQFIIEPEQRRKFFSQIASRLRPGGYLLNADLAADMSASSYASLFDIWQRTLTYSGMSVEQVEKFVAFDNIAVLPSQEVESIIASSGFDAPVLFLQTILIHAWYAKRAA